MVKKGDGVGYVITRFLRFGPSFFLAAEFTPQEFANLRFWKHVPEFYVRGYFVGNQFFLHHFIRLRGAQLFNKFLKNTKYILFELLII